jgi:hypothetical protein
MVASQDFFFYLWWSIFIRQQEQRETHHKWKWSKFPIQITFHILIFIFQVLLFLWVSPPPITLLFYITVSATTVLSPRPFGTLWTMRRTPSPVVQFNYTSLWWIRPVSKQNHHRICRLFYLWGSRWSVIDEVCIWCDMCWCSKEIRLIFMN